jgi:hypothetical protein
MDIERIYDVADAIERALETRPAGEWHTISKIAHRAKQDLTETGIALRWMTEEKYIISNGRGGCWVNYARKH